ncbi:FadR/GntR family transcriptional regulator [Metabacillus arenae]|uniref:FadR family transcriptional regulator n=1 Tax=Metabacillus arenae TaxID=2771434 RepID=A0A926NKH9_9BACI|nr:FadR/GntR family transcriptional regulator [Metabacillus arenae]MBD1382425.1 FadR family transcriptional regulator [Metabacillus arenae]
MSTKFNRLSRTPLTEEIIELIKERITSGEIPIGERLPTEHQLVNDLGVSRSSIREVLITLQAEGFITIKRGKGAYVINKEEFDKNKFIEWLEKSEYEMQELLEIRMAIEPFITYLAAQKAKEEDIRELERINDELEQLLHSKTVKEIVEKDEEFHETILKMAKNQGLEFIYKNFIPRLHEYRTKIFVFHTSPQYGSNPPFIAYHKRILNAIKNRDPENAQKEMLQHVIESQNDIMILSKKIQT